MTHAYKSMGEAYAEVYKLPRQLKDPKKETMVSKDNYGTIVIDKKDWPSYKSKGWKLAEELEEVNLDEKSKYLQYSNLLLQKGKLLGKGFIPTSILVTRLDKEIAKELKKLGIKDGFGEETELEEANFVFTYTDPTSPFGASKRQGGLIVAKDKNTATKEFKKMKPKATIKDVEEVDNMYGHESVEEVNEILPAIGAIIVKKGIAKVAKSISSPKEKEEEVGLTEFTDAQIARLKKEYESLRGKETGINPEKFSKLRKMMRRFKKPQLLKLASADIPMLTTAAKASLVINHGMKWSSIPEELVPFVDELEEGTKFGSVDDKVMKRIEMMMKGSREMKNSIANLLNYLMPPEVVDMVKDKLNIKMPRGKIKF